MNLIAEIKVAKLEDRKTIAAILLENGYTVSPGKKKRTETGKALDYYLRIYKDDLDND